MLFHNQDISSLENATHAFWCQSKLLLDTARTTDTPKILGYQLQLSNLLQLDTPHTLQKRVLNASDLATTLIEDLTREAKATDDSPRQGRPATRLWPCDSTNSRDHNQNSPSFKKGDEVIIAAKTPDGQTGDVRGWLCRQDMTTGKWRVLTPDWDCWISEKFIHRVPVAEHFPSFKKGDKVILRVTNPHNQTCKFRGILGNQDMMTGCWHITTRDCCFYAPEKSIRHAPKGDA